MRKIPQANRAKCPHCQKFIDQVPERMLSPVEVAETLGVHPKTVYRLVSERRLGSIKNSPARSGKVFIPLSALDAYRKSLEARPAL